MAGNILTAFQGKILSLALLALRERLQLARLINRSFDPTPGIKGSSVHIPIPSAIAARKVAPGVTSPVTGAVEPTEAIINVDEWWEAPFTITDKERQEIDDRVGWMPAQMSEAVKAMANRIESSIMTAFRKACTTRVGTAGTTPFATDNV